MNDIDEMIAETAKAIIRRNGTTIYGHMRNLYNSLMFTVARVRAVLWSFVMKDVGPETTIMRGAWICAPHGIKLGKRVTINVNCRLDGGGGLFIGDNVLIAPDVAILTTQHRVNGKLGNYSIGEDTYAPVRIRSGVWIGRGVTVAPGVTIGEHAVIGANAFVNKDVEPYTIYGGVPAKKIRVIK